MSARIPLVISQPALKHAAANDVVESAVAAALLVPGVDANLISDLETIAIGSTDHLCLQGLTRDLVLCGFLTADRAQQSLQRLSIAGRWVDLTASAAAIRASQNPAVAERRIFFYPLSNGQSINDLLDRCRQLVAAQKQPLIQIQLGSGVGSIASSEAARLRSLNSTSQAAMSNSLPIIPSANSAAPAANSHSESAFPTRATVRSSAADEDMDTTEWAALDKLVDDLDSLDL